MLAVHYTQDRQTWLLVITQKYSQTKPTTPMSPRHSETENVHIKLSIIRALVNLRKICESSQVLVHLLLTEARGHWRMAA